MVRILIASLVVVGLGGVAHADFGVVGGHGAYSLGGAVVNGPGDGARNALDAGVTFGWFDRDPEHMMLRTGPTLSTSVVTGFTTSPTFATIEGGHANANDLSGVSWSIGPLLQVDPETRLGGTVRVTADVLLIQLGVRAAVIGADDPELSIAVTLGFGEL